MLFMKWIDVLEAVQLLEENAQLVSYTQMDSLTCGIYPLIPLSDAGFPSHTYICRQQFPITDAAHHLHVPFFHSQGVQM